LPEPARRVTRTVREREPQIVVRAAFALPLVVTVPTSDPSALRSRRARRVRGVRSVTATLPSSVVENDAVRVAFPRRWNRPDVVETVFAAHGEMMSCSSAASAPASG
jgi:hypothetical protein